MKNQRTLLAVILTLWGAGPVFTQSIDHPMVFPLQTYSDRILIGMNIGGADRTEPYILDTGSSRFTSVWARRDGHQPPWWGEHTVDQSVHYSIVYGPGSGETKYDYHPATAAVTLVSLQSPASLSVTSPHDVAQIYVRYTNSDTFQTADWVKDQSFETGVKDAFTDSSKRPYDDQAFGDLGADLSDQQSGLYAIVSGLTFTNGLHSGFSVTARPGSPALTIGVSPDSMNSADAVFPMQMSGDDINQSLVAGDYTLSTGGTDFSFSDVPTLFDTGTPASTGITLTLGTLFNIAQELIVDNHLVEGVSITLAIGDTPYTLNSSDFSIEVHPAPDSSYLGSVIYGLNFFESYEVFYDLDTHQVAVTAVPEPSTLALLGLAAAAVILRRKIR